MTAQLADMRCRITNLSPEGLYSPEEASRYFGNSVHTLRKWRRDGYGPRVIRLGGAIKYQGADLLAFKESCRED